MDSNKILRGKGQITLVDLTDNLQVEAYISTNLQRQVLYNPNNNVYLPNFSNTNMELMPEIIVTGSKENQIANAKSVTWKVKENSKGEWKPITTSLNYTIRNNNLIITSNVMKDFTTMLYAAEIEYELNNGDIITIYTDIELVKLSLGKDGTDGNDSITGVMSNDSMIFSSDSEGKTDSAPQVGKFSIYAGTNKITNNIHYSYEENPYLDLYIDTTGEYAISWKNDIDSIKKVNTEATFNALVIIGTNKVKITKSVSVGKVSLGSSGITYFLEPNSDIITIDKAGNLVPNTLIVKSKKRNGLNPEELFFSDFVVLYSEDNITFTELLRVEKTNSISIKVPQTATSIKINMYHTDTQTLLDSETIPILSYSYPKVDFFITTPMGEIILNHEGVLQAEAHLFENGKKVDILPKWYRRDSGKNAGWEYIQDTKILFASAEDINGSGVYKAEITYKGITYYDFVTFSDITDKYQLKILGATTFTQNRGVLDLIAKVYFDGEEIDKDGSKFLYFWTLYDSKGDKVSIGRTLSSKEIQLHKDEIKNIMDLECKIQTTNEVVLYQVNRSIKLGNLKNNFRALRDIKTKDLVEPYTTIRKISSLETSQITTLTRDISKLLSYNTILKRSLWIKDKTKNYTSLRNIVKIDKISNSTQRDISTTEIVNEALIRSLSKKDFYETKLIRIPSILDKGISYQTYREVSKKESISNQTLRDISNIDTVNNTLIREVITQGISWEDLSSYQWQDILESTWEEISKK